MRMLALALAFSAASVCTIPSQAQAWSEQPISNPQGTTRFLIVFSPDSRSPAFRKQYDLLEHHGLELTERDTVVVPFLAAHRRGDAVYIGENLSGSNTREQAAARTRFNIKPTDFSIVLLDKDGQEQQRWTNPISIREFTSKVGAQKQDINFYTRR